MLVIGCYLVGLIGFWFIRFSLFGFFNILELTKTEPNKVRFNRFLVIRFRFARFGLMGKPYYHIIFDIVYYVVRITGHPYYIHVI